MQLNNDCINKIENEIKKLTTWCKLTKHLDEEEKEVHDANQLMAKLLFNSASPNFICKSINEMSSCAKMIHLDLKIQPLIPLKSFANGKEQFCHGNYDLEIIEKLEKGLKYYSATFSFSNPTHILVKDEDGDESKMKIPCRHVLI